MMTDSLNNETEDIEESQCMEVNADEDSEHIVEETSENVSRSISAKKEKYYEKVSREAKLQRSRHNNKSNYIHVRIFGAGEMEDQSEGRKMACAYGRSEDDGLAVYAIPFDEMFEKPDDIISEYDISTEEGKSDYLKRQQQVLRKLITYRCPVTVISAVVDTAGHTRIFASRVQALRNIRRNYFITEKRYIVGEMYTATVMSVGRTSLAVTFNGVDFVLPLWQLTYRYVQKMEHFFAVGDELEFKLKGCEVKDEDNILLDTDFKAAERDKMLIMQNFVDIGTALVGIVVNVNRYKNTPHIYIDFPDVGICGFATNLNPDRIDGALKSGDGVLCSVKSHEINGLIRVNIIGRYNAVRSIYRPPADRKKQVNYEGKLQRSHS